MSRAFGTIMAGLFGGAIGFLSPWLPSQWQFWVITCPMAIAMGIIWGAETSPTNGEKHDAR